MTIVAAPPAMTGPVPSPRGRIVLRHFVVVAVLLSLLALGLTLRAAHAADGPTDEAEFVTRINALRAERGLPALREDPELVRGARAWARQMAAAGGISHMPESSLRTDIKETWCKIGENVGEGPEVGLLHDAFVKSPLHLKNLVDPDFDAVGIGIVYAADQDGEQIIYVAQRFLDSDDVCRRQDAAAASTKVEGATATRVPTQLALAAKPTTAAPAGAKPKPKVKKAVKPTVKHA